MEDTQTWLNEELLCSVLKADLEGDPDRTNTTKEEKKTNFTITDYEAKSAVEDGKNFSSKVYKVSVSYKGNEGKVRSNSYIMKKLISVLTTANNEVCVREENTLKALMKIENYVNRKLGPKIYMVKDNIVVTDDLTVQGFENPRVKLLDYDHCALALKSLAEFHAGSLLLHKHNPSHVEYEIGFDIFNFISSIFDLLAMFENNILHFGKEISTWPETQQYAEHFSFIATKIRGYYGNLCKRDSLKVLNHGDYHLNNMMFRYEDNKVCDVRMIDFQTTRFVPPTCDFQYFMGSNTNFDVRYNRVDELVSLYLETFNRTSTCLGLPQRMTREQFEEGLKKDNIMYILGMVGPLLMWLADPEDIAFNLEDMEGNLTEEVNERFTKMLKSKEIRKCIPRLLDTLNKNGVFQSFRE